MLNLALEKGVISDALFAMLVMMALVTTFMAGPLLRLLDPEERVRRPARGGARARRASARRPSSRSWRCPSGRSWSRRRATTALCAAARARRAARALGAAARADPRAASCGRRAAPRRAAALQTENRLLARGVRRGHHRPARADRAGHRRAGGRVHLGRPGRRPRRGWPTARRWTCCSWTAGGRCSARACRAATSAPCCARRRATWRCSSRASSEPVAPGPERPVRRPVRRRRARLGGARARRLDRRRRRARRCSCSAPRAQPTSRSRVTRLLGDAGLLVQQYAGVAAEPRGRRARRRRACSGPPRARGCWSSASPTAGARRASARRARRSRARAGAGGVRAPRPAPGRARAAGGRHALHVVRRGNGPSRVRRAQVGRNLAKAAAVELVDEAAHTIAM